MAARPASLQSAVGHAITSAVSVICTLGALSVALRDSETSELQTAYDRIQWLERSTQQLTTDLRARDDVLRQTGAEIYSLKLRLQLEQDAIDSICDVIDAMISPAWAKQYHPDAPVDRRITMQCINSYYEHEYHVAEPRYVGATDIEIHGVAIGQQYMAHDLRVIARKKGESFTELVRVGDGTVRQRFTKIYLQTEDGREFILGFRLPDD